MIRFEADTYFHVLWLLPLCFVFYRWATRRRREALAHFIQPRLHRGLISADPSRVRRREMWLTLAAIAFMTVALARPIWGYHWQEVKRRGLDIMIALDVSSSMLAEDVSPNRLERAKREIIDLLRILEGDRVGLIAYAGVPFLQCPMTLDYNATQIFLDEIATDLIPVPGTGIAKAIELAIRSYPDQDQRSRALILITDGEDHLGKPIEAAEKAREAGIKIYPIGIGRPEGVPIPNASGGFKKDAQGEVILTKLDEATLRQIASITEGLYVRSVSGDLDLERIYGDIRGKLDDREIQGGKRRVYHERFRWPLAAAFLCLWWIEVRRRRIRFTRSPRSKRVIDKVAACSLIIWLNCIGSFSTHAFAASAAKNVKQGAKKYLQGEYEEALKHYLDAQVDRGGDARLNYNLGNTYYKQGEYDKAQQFYKNALPSEDANLRKKSYYNLGNSAFKQGKLQDAIENYENALSIDPNDDDAKHNLGLAKQLLQQQQQKQQEGDSDQDQQDDSKQQSPSQQQPSGDPEQEKHNSGQQQQSPDADQQEQPQPNEGASPEPGSDADSSQDAQTQEADQELTMSKEEAERWLSTEQEDRAKFIKKRLKQKQEDRPITKDW